MESSNEFSVVAACKNLTARHRCRDVMKAWSRLRDQKWISKNLQIITDVEVMQSLDDACQQVRQSPRERFLINLGFDLADLPRTAGSTFQIVTVLEEKNQDPHQVGSASLLQTLPDDPKRPLTMMTSNPRSAVRKGLWRQVNRDRVSVRPIRQCEIRDYLHLRYSVWKEQNYIPSWKLGSTDDAGLEVDYTDLFSDALGVFLRDEPQTSRRAKLVACGRLVREPRMHERTSHGRDVEKFVKSEQTNILEHLRKPPGQHPPYDVLISFEGFLEYYAERVRHRDKSSEVSRIAVLPEYRGQGLGEILVDSLIDLAYSKGIRYVFLGCEESNKGFYGRCGFLAIDGVRCDKFVDVGVPAIAMHRELRDRRVMARV